MSSPVPTSGSSRIEEARIRAAYAKRQKDEARYSYFSMGNLFRMQELEQCLLTLLKRHDLVPLNTKKILEVGCGTGYWLREFIKWGARPENITGIDLLDDRIAEARYLCPEAVGILHGNAAELAFSNATFDLVVQFTVFTSVLDSIMKQQMASEMLRVVKDDGFILWYDYHVILPTTKAGGFLGTCIAHSPSYGLATGPYLGIYAYSACATAQPVYDT